MIVSELITELQKLPHQGAKVMLTFRNDNYRVRFKDLASVVNGQSKNDNFGMIILANDEMQLLPDFAKKIVHMIDYPETPVDKPVPFQ